ncbi:MAG: discoidin domain-containing protein [Polyangia bacterium]
MPTLTDNFAAAGLPSEGADGPSAASSPDAGPPVDFFWTRLVDWILARSEMRESREHEAVMSPARRAALARAHARAQAADWLVESGARSAAAALSLYREAAFWLLAPDGQPAASLAAAAEAAPRAELEEAAGGAAQFAWLRTVLFEKDFVCAAAMTEDEQGAAAAKAGVFVRSLLLREEAWSLAYTRARRRLRVFLTLLTAVTGMVLVVSFAAWIVQPTDLAQGKPWRTSSVLNAIFPANIFFHTNLETNPWLEIDLGKPTEIHSLYIRNRSDCGQERAVPLIVEASLDAATWRELVRHDTIFTIWNPTFAPTTARLVRLRIPRFSALHLEQVKVF